MKKKIFGLVLSFSILLSNIAYGASFDKDKDDVIYGAALNAQQRKIVDNAIEINSEDFNVATVNGADLEKYLGYGTSDSNMISSIVVKRLKKGSGIKVMIKTPGNINQITEAQYTNAAITAGLSDAEIFVASPKPVTGESALVGVYKSEELHGENLDPQRTKTAQKELKTVIEVSKQNESNPNFDSKKLDRAVIEVKEKLADYKEKNGQTAPDDEILVFVLNALENVDMKDVLSNENLKSLITYFKSYQDLSGITNTEVRDNLFKLAKDIGGKAGKFYEENKDSIDKFAKDNKENFEKIAKDAKDSGLLDKVINFLKDIVNSIISVFNKDNNNSNNQ
ncbi:DUF1002 domain-containing protein [uncultured Anaerococcus sp.]|uniref:DUF1002 domain-containing protein n=1 Tax=uncultured Anaerococcus sp. TaxID=293428 RepID=UPI00288BAF23|nr:DUF1002 domain-containing protein [uncultured Anaerococcus sp.]